MNIGKNIYELRKAKKLTQAELAEKLGVTDQAVSKWENSVCAPDVALFPVIAEFFGVSIDRLYGFHLNSYEDEVKRIIDAADESQDTDREIEIVRAGLERYPNSPDLKIYLAFSLSMINRRSKDEEERKNAVAKAIKLCREVVDTCGDTKKVDRAFNMLVRIYNETGEYGKAEECLSKLSADSFLSRITGMVHLLAGKEHHAELYTYAETTLWELYLAMSNIFDQMTITLAQNGENEKALAFFDAYEKVLSIFDHGCPDFYATDKLFACERKARLLMEMGDKEKCLAELERFFVLAEQVKAVAKVAKRLNTHTYIAVRNPVFFSNVKEENAQEEYMSDVFPEKMLWRYDALFGDDAAYRQFKERVTAE